jgi:HEAT repeat protein
LFEDHPPPPKPNRRQTMADRYNQISYRLLVPWPGEFCARKDDITLTTDFENVPTVDMPDVPGRDRHRVCVIAGAVIAQALILVLIGVMPPGVGNSASAAEKPDTSPALGPVSPLLIAAEPLDVRPRPAATAPAPDDGIPPEHGVSYPDYDDRKGPSAEMLPVLRRIKAMPIAPSVHPAVKEAIGRLHSSSAVTRANGAWRIEQLASRAAPAIPMLAELLADNWESHGGNVVHSHREGNWIIVETSRTRHARPAPGLRAGLALAAIGKQSTPALLPLLSSPELAIRQRAACILGKTGDPTAIDPLISLLQRDPSGAGPNAAEALGELKAVAALPIFKKLLIQYGGEKPPVVEFSKVVMYHGGDYRPGHDLAETIYWSMEQIGSPAAATLIDLLEQSKDSTLRWYVVWRLRSFQDHSVTEALLATMQSDKRRNMQERAALALGYSEDAHARGLALDFVLQQIAATEERLKALKASSSLTRRWPLLDPNDPSYSSLTIEDLQHMRDPRAVCILVDMVRNHQGGRAEEPLVLLRELSVPELIKALGEEQTVALKAREILVRIRSAAVPGLVEGLGSSDAAIRIHCANALGDIGDRSAVPALIAALGQDDAFCDSCLSAISRCQGAPKIRSRDRAELVQYWRKWLENNKPRTEDMVIPGK